jgi:hypothetical protein
MSSRQLFVPLSDADTLVQKLIILASREEAAQMLSISQRALDYLIATRRLPTRRIGGPGSHPRLRATEICADRSSRADRGLGHFGMGVIGCVFGCP